MKKPILLILSLLFYVHANAQIVDKEQSLAISYLESTHQNIVDLVEPLSEEAWNYTPEDGGWSVANCLEHILITEASFFQMAQGFVNNSESSPGFGSPVNDGVLIGMMANRGNNVQTAAQFEPSGKWTTKQEMLSALKDSRTNLINFLSENEENLRDIPADTPFGQLDTYQLFLVIAGHSQRHTFQMQEVLGEMPEE